MLPAAAHPLLANFRILMSYWYYKQTDLITRLPQVFPQYMPPIFADSGAFSAMTQGGDVSLEEYAAWLTRFKHLFAVYANLDVIRHPHQTWNNQQRLEQEYGLHPLPVFHVATPWHWLEHYLDRYPYIALGVAGHSQERYMGWLVKCFQMGKGRAVYHGFGITAWTAWKSFPWYSVDSSSWGQGFRYGVVTLFLPERGTWVRARLGDRRTLYLYAQQLRDLGFDPEDFADRKRATRARICTLVALNYLRACESLRELHGPIAIPSREEDPGLHLYLTEANHGFRDAGFVAKGLHEPEGGPQVYLSDTSSFINYRAASRGLQEVLGEGPQMYLEMYLADAQPQLQHWQFAANGLQEGPHMYLADGSLGLSNWKSASAGLQQMGGGEHAHQS